jgi:hypothetical protein
MPLSVAHEKKKRALRKKFNLKQNLFVVCFKTAAARGAYIALVSEPSE